MRAAWLLAPLWGVYYKCIHLSRCIFALPRAVQVVDVKTEKMVSVFMCNNKKCTALKTCCVWVYLCACASWNLCRQSVWWRVVIFGWFVVIWQLLPSQSTIACLTTCAFASALFWTCCHPRHSVCVMPWRWLHYHLTLYGHSIYCLRCSVPSNYYY